MRKFLIGIIFSFITLNLFGATSTLTFLSSCGGTGIANDGAVWTVTSNAAESNFDASRGIHYGTNNVAVSYLRLSTSDISGTITQIIVNASGGSSTAAKLNVTVGGNAFGSEKSLTSSATNYTLTGSATGEIIVAITQPSTKKALYCKSITVTYTPNTTYTVSFVNFLGKNPDNISQSSQGGSISLPSSIDICDKCYDSNLNFEGWVESITNYTVPYTTSYTPSDNVTLYALYSHGVKNVYIEEYKKVTSSLSDWSGDYLIAYTSNRFADGRIGGKDDNGSIGKANIYVTPGSNMVGDTVINVDWGNLYNVSLEEISEGSGTYVLKTKDGKYNYWTNNTKNGLQTSTVKSTAASYPITVNFQSSSDIRLSLGGAALGSVLRYNPSENIFRFYKDCSQQPVYLYKKVSKSISTEYTTSPECDLSYVSVWNTNSITIPEEDLPITNPTNISIINIESGTTITNRTSLSLNNGEYVISTPNLSNNSCDKINILVEGTDSLYLIYKAPILVTSNSTTNSSIFTSETNCNTCDVVLTNNSKLTIDNDLTTRNIKVYEGCTLNIQSGKTYTINSISLRKTDDTNPYLTLNGNLSLTSDSSFYLDIYTDPSEWRWLALPDTFDIRNITLSSGKSVTHGEDYLIKTYDGNKRAIERKNGWWQVSNDKVFMPGEGFIFGIVGDGTVKQEYRFKFANSILSEEKRDKKLKWDNLQSWGCNNTELRPNHKGWNLIGNAFLDLLNTELYSPIRIGYLEHSDTDPWDGKWILSDTISSKLRYRVIYERGQAGEDGNGYSSQLLDGKQLEPFSAFFVQLGGSIQTAQQINLHVDHRRNVIKRMIMTEEEDDELFLRIFIGDKKTGMFISNKFNEDYEPGDDLESHQSIYQSINGYKLLYSAVPDSTIEKGVTVHSTGGHLELDDKVIRDKFEYIYVKVGEDWYNLLFEEVDVENDFVIYAKRKSNIPTNLELIPTNGTYKFIYNKNVYINSNNKLYNILGIIQ